MAYVAKKGIPLESAPWLGFGLDIALAQHIEII